MTPWALTCSLSPSRELGAQAPSHTAGSATIQAAGSRVISLTSQSPLPLLYSGVMTAPKLTELIQD